MEKRFGSARSRNGHFPQSKKHRFFLKGALRAVWEVEEAHQLAAVAGANCRGRRSSSRCRCYTCHGHSSNTGRPPAQQLKHEQQQHGAWEEQLELCDRGRLQLDAGSVKAPFSRQKSRKIAFAIKTLAKKSPAACNVVTHSLGGGAARLPEARPLTEAHMPPLPPCVQYPT